MPQEQQEKEEKALLKLVEGAKKDLDNLDLDANSYHVGFQLTDNQIRVATIYEIAKQSGKTMQDVYVNYNIETIPLQSVQPGEYGVEDALLQEVADKTSRERPTIVLVNYKTANEDGSYGAAHWMPVIITKDQSGNDSITKINSSTSPQFNTEESELFVAQIISLFLGCTYEDASRDVQLSNVCGLASANAAGIALSSKEPIANAFKEKEMDRLKPVELGENEQESGVRVNEQEVSYIIQGKKTFAMLSYLSILPDGLKDTNIADLEKAALLNTRVLSQAQIDKSTNIDKTLKETVKLSLKLNAIFKPSGNLRISEDERTELIKELMGKYQGNGGATYNEENAAKFEQEASDYVMALKLQAKELGFDEQKPVHAKEIINNTKAYYESISSSNSGKRPTPTPKNLKPGKGLEL